MSADHQRWYESKEMRDPILADQDDREAIFNLVMSLDKNSDDKLSALVSMTKKHKSIFLSMGICSKVSHVLSVAAINRVLPIERKKQYTLAQYWADLLESGRYQQAQGRLVVRKEYNNTEGYCCLGVACDAFLSGEWVGNPRRYYYEPLNNSSYVMKMSHTGSSLIFGDHVYLESVLASLNDVNKYDPGIPRSVLSKEYGLVIAFLRSLPELEDCGLLFEEYKKAIEIFQEMYPHNAHPARTSYTGPAKKE